MRMAIGAGLERLFVALVPAGIGAGLMFPILRGLSVGTTGSTCLSSAFALAGTIWLARRLPPELDGALRRSTLLTVLWALVGISAVAATARLAVFMADETKVGYSIYSFDDFFVHHSCLSAHFQAARLHRAGVPNVYERTLYEGPQGEPKFVGSFVIDTFLYPPPFLLLARLGLALSEDFARWRVIWFGVEGALVGLALLMLAQWIGGPIGRRVALLSVLVWLSLPNLTTLQFGNFHLVAITGSILAMLAFERGRHAMGGGVLAALALSKVFPGILVLFLLFQRRWRSVAWTGGFAALLLAVSYVLLGVAPFSALLSYHLPRMATGAALETLFAHPDVIAANQAVYGLAQKLSLLGMPGASQDMAVAISWGYTLVLVAAAAGRVVEEASMQGKLRRALVWLALVQLASLRAPFTPDTYALFAPIWMLVLLLANAGRSGWRPIGLVALIVLGNFMVPAVEIMPLQALLVLTAVHQLLFLSLAVAIIAVSSRRAVASVAIVR